MGKTFFLEIITPNRKFLSEDVDMIVFDTPEGEMAVMAGHMRLVTLIDIGYIKILKDGVWREAVVSEGYVDIHPKMALLIVDTAEWPEEIDVNRAAAAAERARERLVRQQSTIEYMKSQAALQRALSRLEASGKRKK